MPVVRSTSPPLVLGRLGRVQRLPGRRGGLVQLPQGFGDGRTMLFKHGDGHGQLSPDLVEDQVGRSRGSLTPAHLLDQRTPSG